VQTRLTGVATPKRARYVNERRHVNGRRRPPHPRLPIYHIIADFRAERRVPDPFFLQFS
jgi:hypothetical protein